MEILETILEETRQNFDPLVITDDITDYPKAEDETYALLNLLGVTLAEIERRFREVEKDLGTSPELD